LMGKVKRGNSDLEAGLLFMMAMQEKQLLNGVVNMFTR
jgi:hypothetical protein